MIRIKNINKYYETGGEKIHAVRNLSVTFPNEGLVFIVGPSGSGKSTLLNLLGGLDKPDSGEIWIEDREISTFSASDQTNYLNSYLGFVFQEYNILKELSLKENICLPLELQGVKKKVVNEKFKQIIKDVDLTGLEKRKVNELSGGQKQRIAIARALIKDPKLIIADEPTGNLDSETSKNIFDIFKKLSKSRLVIIVTHDEESALTYGDMIVRISPDGDSLHEIIDNKKAAIDEEHPNKLVLKRAHVPLKTSLKLALKNMWQKKFRYFIMFLVCALSLMFLAFTIELNVSNEKLRENVYTMVENGYRFTEVYQKTEMTKEEIKEDIYNKYAYSNTLNSDAYSDLKSKLTSVTIHEYATVKIPYTTALLENANSFYTGYIESLICYDSSNEYELLAGRLPDENKKEILITDYLIAAFKNFNMYPLLSTPEDYINFKIDLRKNTNYTIVGVIKTDYEKWTEFQNITDASDIDYTTHKDYMPFINDYMFFNSVIIPKTYFNAEKNDGVSVLLFNEKKSLKSYLGTWDAASDSGTLDTYSEKSALALTSDEISIASFAYDLEGNYSYTFGRRPTEVAEGEIPEIAIPVDWLNNGLIGINAYHGTSWNLTYSSIVLDNNGLLTDWSSTQIRRHYRMWEDQIKNKVITLTLTNYDGEEEYQYTQEFKIVGLYFKEQNAGISNYTTSAVVANSIYNDLYSSHYNDTPNIILELPKNAELALLTFNEAYRAGYVINVWKYRSDIDSYKVDEFIDIASKAGLYIFALFAIGIIWTVVSIEIVDARKEIGILRSIGLSSGRVAFIFIFQCVTVIFLSYFLGVYGAYKLIPIYNSGIMDEYNQIILYIYSFTYRTPLYLGLFIIGMSFISVAFPLGKIMSHKIIDVINERDN